ncbi:MAG: hypothetical protein K6F71_15340 [Ruminococcus sp.]|uniref:hypothetical protein n=1 Tax=Ruminococcus sp. TaxID=41978 RepID=UPI0025CF41AC|nr:hypothetical protein [Ruminococcus sp.]MCR5542181.1 hypothetical protein [Ruminococcus sp.]
MSELEKNLVAENRGSTESANHLFLRNIGAYVCELDILVFRDGEEKRIHGTGKDICVGQSEELDLTNYNIEKGEMVNVYVNVKGGKDTHGNKWVEYDPEVNRRANYEACGTTLINHCDFLGTTSI